METADCPFCQPLPKDRILAESNPSIALLDGFPVSSGHALLVPRRHVVSLFDLPEAEFLQLRSQVGVIRSRLADRFHPAGFNIGINDGEAAGQTVGHAHIIPRYEGDSPDPRGACVGSFPRKPDTGDTA